MEVGETLISPSKIGTYQELCFYFLHRTEVGCETSVTTATERSVQINGLNLSMFFGCRGFDQVKWTTVLEGISGEHSDKR